MPQANIYFTQEEDIIIERKAREWKLSKNETVRRIIRDYDKFTKEAEI